MITSNPHPGRDSFSPAQRIGEFLVTYFRQHPDFYLFSPDETTSNKLDTLYDHTARAWHLPRASFDLPESGSGHIIELLSENTLFACMTGHLISGSPAAMTSYEAFFSIITSQILQHLKFLQQSQSVSWRPAYPSANAPPTPPPTSFPPAPAGAKTTTASPINLPPSFPPYSLSPAISPTAFFRSTISPPKPPPSMPSTPKTASTSSPSTKLPSPAG